MPNSGTDNKFEIRISKFEFVYASVPELTPAKSQKRFLGKLAAAVTLFDNIDRRDEGLVANKRAFWVLSKQPKEIGSFGRMRVPAQFKTVQEATRYCRELNLKKGAYHPGYFIEERIGNQPVSAPAKKMDDSAEEPDK